MHASRLAARLRRAYGVPVKLRSFTDDLLAHELRRLWRPGGVTELARLARHARQLLERGHTKEATDAVTAEARTRDFYVRRISYFNRPW